MSKVSVKQDHFISMDGVERVWVVTCSHLTCVIRGYDPLITLFWDNAIRMADQHIQWHKLETPTYGTG